MCERLGRLYDQCARLAAEGAALALVDGDLGAWFELACESSDWSDRRDAALLSTLGPESPIN